MQVAAASSKLTRGRSTEKKF
uniref:Uncharacterized protein n=1 Tax=Arundo donax TaxID=35708 RepID=A0A0A9B2G7_ARUDO